MPHNQARSPKSQVPPDGQTAGECFPTPRIIQGIQLDDLSDARETREGFRTFPSEYSHATVASTARRGRDHSTQAHTPAWYGRGADLLERTESNLPSWLK